MAVANDLVSGWDSAKGTQGDHIVAVSLLHLYLRVTLAD
ncbi:hypothetical protein HNR12_002037 [Streptomonospora nanhaiensis]|uniref:Uncharacterized protein n=1 Tax=Streptomonospora nanhaiensis TaxID=1323731 RepID=A0A853BL90_9ACTN|nr:hypothetical protein [Streptomonospora nanhaiensis]